MNPHNPLQDNLNIRTEMPGDEAAIADLVERAFGQPDEARLVERLRADGDLVLSLVAESDGAIAGHILFSRMEAPFRALGLAPLAVATGQQRRGIGAALILEGLERARAEGWDAVFVLGDPEYYGRFGFSAELAGSFASPYAGPHFMVLALAGPLPSMTGPVDYAPAFGAFE